MPVAGVGYTMSSERKSIGNLRCVGLKVDHGCSLSLFAERNCELSDVGMV